MPDLKWKGLASNVGQFHQAFTLLYSQEKILLGSNITTLLRVLFHQSAASRSKNEVRNAYEDFKVRIYPTLRCDWQADTLKFIGSRKTMIHNQNSNNN